MSGVVPAKQKPKSRSNLRLPIRQPLGELKLSNKLIAAALVVSLILPAAAFAQTSAANSNSTSTNWRTDQRSIAQQQRHTDDDHDRYSRRR